MSLYKYNGVSIDEFFEKSSSTGSELSGYSNFPTISTSAVETASNTTNNDTSNTYNKITYFCYLDEEVPFAFTYQGNNIFTSSDDARQIVYHDTYSSVTGETEITPPTWANYFKIFMYGKIGSNGSSVTEPGLNYRENNDNNHNTNKGLTNNNNNNHHHINYNWSTFTANGGTGGETRTFWTPKYVEITSNSVLKYTISNSAGGTSGFTYSSSGTTTDISIQVTNGENGGNGSVLTTNYDHNDYETRSGHNAHGRNRDHHNHNWDKEPVHGANGADGTVSISPDNISCTYYHKSETSNSSNPLLEIYYFK